MVACRLSRFGVAELPGSSRHYGQGAFDHVPEGSLLATDVPYQWFNSQLVGQITGKTVKGSPLVAPSVLT